MTVRQISAGAGEYELTTNQIFSDYEKELFTQGRVAGREGRQARSICWWFRQSIRSTPWCRPHRACRPRSWSPASSESMESSELARRIGLAWEKHARAAPSVLARDHRSGTSDGVREPGSPPAASLARGSRAPASTSGCACRKNAIGSRLHHRDVVGIALRRLERDLDGGRQDDVFTDLDSDMKNGG